MNVQDRLARMGHQLRQVSGSRHRVPLIAYAASIQSERTCRLLPRHLGWRCNHAPAAVGCWKATAREQSGLDRTSPWIWPLCRPQLVIGDIIEVGQRADIEKACTFILECRECGVFAKDARGCFERKSILPAHMAPNFGKHPPVRLRHAWSRVKAPLTRDTALGICNGSVLFGPP